MFDGLLTNLRFSARSLGKTKLVTIAAIATFALGIGANTAIFSGVYAYLFTPLPYPLPDQLVSISEVHQTDSGQGPSVSRLNAQDWRDAHAIDSLFLYRFQPTQFGKLQRSEISAVLASPDMFKALGATAAIGRVFRADEGESSRVAIVSYGFWRKHFARAGYNISGQQIDLDGQSHDVVGVMPSTFRFLYQDVDVFLPVATLPSSLDSRDERRFAAIARLRPGYSVQTAQTELARISERLQRDWPDSNLGWTAKVSSLEDFLIPRNSRTGAVTAVVAVALVLLIACSNVANLLLARGIGRRKELAIRSAMGASQRRIFALLLSESMLLASAGAIVGMLLALGGIPILKSITPEGTPRIEAMQLNFPALTYTVFLTFLCGLVAGVTPAFSFSKADLAGVLQAESRSSTGNRGMVLRAISILQMAAALGLLTATLLLIRSLQHQLNSSPGFDRASLLVSRMSLPVASSDSNIRSRRFYSQLLQTVAQDRELRTSAAASAIPLGACGPLVRLNAENRPNSDRRAKDYACSAVITPRFFTTLRVSMLSGRDFTFDDDSSRPAVAIVNETFARSIWAGEKNVIGRRFRTPQAASSGEWITVVGICKDIRPEGVDWPVNPQFYRPHAQTPIPDMQVLVRVRDDPARTAARLRAAALSISRDAIIYETATIDAMLTQRAAASAAMATILGFLAFSALLLASIGIYGLMGYASTQRMREFGIRGALGARRHQIFGLVLSQGLRSVVLAICIGTPISYGLAPTLRSLLVGVPPHDAFSFIMVPLILMLSALVACAVPAWRATRADPVACLRTE